MSALGFSRHCCDRERLREVGAELWLWVTSSLQLDINQGSRKCTLGFMAHMPILYVEIEA